MKTYAIALAIIIAILIPTQASLFGKLFFGHDKPVEENKVARDLSQAREHAYNSWQEAAKGASDLSHAAWDTMYEGYEAAWLKYQDVKDKIWESAESALSTAVKDYEIARDALKEAAKKITDFLESYKDKVEEKISDVFFSGLETVEEAASVTKKKYVEARDKIGDLYDKAYEEALDDYNSASQYLNDATERVKKFSEQKKGKDHEQTKKKLENARDRARHNYKVAKKRAQETKSKLDEFNSEISTFVQEHFELTKLRANEAVDSLKHFKDDAKWKAHQNYNQFLSSMQKISDRANNNLQEAELAVNFAKNRISKWSTRTLESIRQKYLNLKDEL